MTNALNNAIIIIIIIIIVISIIDIIGSSGKLVSYLVFYNTFSKNSLYHAIEVGNLSEVGFLSDRGGRQRKYHAVKP